MCTANPVAVEDKTADLSKMFSASELHRAANAGVSNESLIEHKSMGLTFEETIEFNSFKNDPEMARASTIDITVGSTKSLEVYVVTNLFYFYFKTKLCKIFIMEHKTASNFSVAQELQLAELIQSMERNREERILFIVITINLNESPCYLGRLRNLKKYFYN